MKTKNAFRPLLLTFYDTFINKFKNKEDKSIFKLKKNFKLLLKHIIGGIKNG